MTTHQLTQTVNHLLNNALTEPEVEAAVGELYTLHENTTDAADCKFVAEALAAMIDKFMYGPFVPEGN